jgi:hypothetical protein
MAKKRLVRRGYVEYQPDLKHPVDPVPLGVLTEEIISEGRRHIALVGREPNGAMPGVNLDKLWGPFKAAVTDWFEILSKNVSVAVKELPDDQSVVDHLAMQWRSNVYIREPETLELAATRETLMRYATRWYSAYVGEPFQEPAQQRRRGPTRNVMPTARTERISPVRRRTTKSPEALCVV